jgi:hypothetical protein
LNREKDFSSKIDWNFLEYGRLWAYNLNYFDYLLQPAFDVEQGLRLIIDFVENKHNIQTGYEPYPTSLRTVNWIKFCTFNNIHKREIDCSLYAQFVILNRNLEYHLLANHLLENAFALMFGAYYFRDSTFYTKARKLLIEQLNEQILDDGAHFELSPMYHKIILFRLLDCYNLVENNDWKNDAELLSLIKSKAAQMLGWIASMRFGNGEIPHLNDSTDGIAPEIFDLEKYADRLNINRSTQKLSASGYRKFESSVYECICDVGKIGPDYQPGHAHADTFSFVMNIHNRAVIVDTGCSTYEWGKLRDEERGTASHNTVVIGSATSLRCSKNSPGLWENSPGPWENSPGPWENFPGLSECFPSRSENANSSQIWGSHRVAHRAKVTILDETAHSLKASHNGYKRFGCTHTRQFVQETADVFTIIDTVVGGSAGIESYAYLHFASGEDFDVNRNIVIGKDYSIEYEGAVSIAVCSHDIASGFNRRTPSRSVKILFHNTLITKIHCDENTIYNG